MSGLDLSFDVLLCLATVVATALALWAATPRRRLGSALSTWLATLTAARALVAITADDRLAVVGLAATGLFFRAGAVRPAGPGARRTAGYLGLARALALAGAALVPAASAGPAAMESERAHTGLFLLLASLTCTLGGLPFQSWRPHLAGAAHPVAAAALLADPLPVLVLARLVRARGGDCAVSAEVFGVLLALTALYAGSLSLVQRSPRRWLGWFAGALHGVAAAALLSGDGSAVVAAEAIAAGTAVGVTGLAVCLGGVEARAGELDLKRWHGLGAPMPFLAHAFLVLGLAAIGFPGTPCFAGHEIALESLASHFGLVAAGALVAGLALGGLSMLRVQMTLFRGCAPQPGAWVDATARERRVLAALVLAVVLGGLAPWLVLEPLAGAHANPATHLSAAGDPAPDAEWADEEDPDPDATLPADRSRTALAVARAVDELTAASPREPRAHLGHNRGPPSTREPHPL